MSRPETRWKAFRRWYREFYTLLSIVALLVIAAFASGDQLNAGLKRLFDWSSSHGPWVQLLVALAVLHLLLGLIRFTVKVVVDPLRPEIERSLEVIFQPIVDWLNRREKARDELAQIEYCYR